MLLLLMKFQEWPKDYLPSTITVGDSGLPVKYIKFLILYVNYLTSSYDINNIIMINHRLH